MSLTLWGEKKVITQAKHKKKTCKRKRKKKKQKNKQTNKKTGRRRKKKQPTASHPSVKGQRPQERWIGAHWESQETPVAQLPTFGFGPHYRLPAF